MVVVSHGITDPGCVRTTNEDRILADDAGRLYVVCDGIGGRRRGEVAAEVAVHTIQQYIASSADPTEVTWPFGFNARISFAANRLLTAIRLANRQVWRRSEESMESLGMGTTITAMLIDGHSAAIANIGDSRTYCFRDGRLAQLTTDDTAVLNLPSGDASSGTTARRILTSAVGSQEDVEVHLRDELLHAGDVLLLCSDGLHSAIADEQIAALLARQEAAPSVAGALIEAARAANASDNVSVIVLQCR